MKVSELLLERQSGAYYNPAYKDKNLLGSVKDWLDAGGVKPEHIKQAMDHVRGGDAFAKAKEAGLIYSPNSKAEKNGTFYFKVARKGYDNQPGRLGREQNTYIVHANGQIRSSSDNNWGGEARTRLASPKPRMVSGDPVKSLVKTYDSAISELTRKWKKSKNNPSNK